MVRVADTLQEVLDKNGYDYKLKRSTISTCCLSFLSWFSQEAADAVTLIKLPERHMTNKQSRELLGIEYKRTTEEMLLAAAESLMESGSIPTLMKEDK